MFLQGAVVWVAFFWIFLITGCDITAPSLRLEDDILSAELLAHYPFEGDAKDIGPFSKNGQIVGSPVFQPGIIGQAIEFNNEAAFFDLYVKDYVELPPINAGFDFSISHWVYFRDNASLDYESFTFSAGILKLERMFGFAIDISARDYNATPMKWRHDDTEVARNYHTGFALPKNEWAHVVVTSSRNSMTTYINGALATSIPTEVEFEFNHRSFVAAHQWHDEPYKSSRFNGMIDDLRIYKGQLSPEDIQALYQMGVGKN